MTVHFLRNCVIITGFFFIGIFAKRIEWCEEDSLPSSLAFLSTWNESVLKDRLDAERATPVKKKLFPIVRNLNVLHQRRVNWCSTRVSLNCLKESQGIFGILALLESCLAASFMNKSKPTCFPEKSRAPCFANAFSSTGLIVSQSSAASGCLSSWS